MFRRHDDEFVRRSVAASTAAALLTTPTTTHLDILVGRSNEQHRVADRSDLEKVRRPPLPLRVVVETSKSDEAVFFVALIQHQ
jgi:hypothetical protein